VNELKAAVAAIMRNNMTVDKQQQIKDPHAQSRYNLLL
jgi:hypothetical protein